MQNFIVFAALGTELGGMIFLAWWLESLFGERLGTKGLLFLALTFIFLISWFIQIIWLLRRTSKAATEATKNHSEV